MPLAFSEHMEPAVDQTNLSSHHSDSEAVT